MKRGKVKKLMSLILTVVMIMSCIAVSAPAVAETTTSDQLTPLRILEIEPGPDYTITAEMKAELEAFYGRSIELAQMPMPMFVSKVDQVNGYYDIVYVGNKKYTKDPNSSKYGGDVYSRFGPSKYNNKELSKPNYAAYYATLKQGVKEFYSGNDITDKTAEFIKNFIESKQLAIFDTGIFDNSLRTTKLYENFERYKTGTGYPNFKVGTVSSLKDDLKKYGEQGTAKRPGLTVTSKPAQYNGSNVIANSGILSFAMNINSINNKDRMTVKLFIDKNGDGIYQDSEKVREETNVYNTVGYSINYLLPKSFTGLVPWKIEVTDSLGAKAYDTGFTAYKGDELLIRVLQLLPTGGNPTLDLTTLRNYNGQNLLYKPGEYNIVVTTMKINDFNGKYGSTAAGKTMGQAGDYITTLNGNYDMVIVGFDDSYVGDLDNTKGALNALTAFADQKQSIMFVHDTVGFYTGSSNNNLTTAFRDRLGLNAFKTDPTLPEGTIASTGMTRLALYNANGGPYFPDTVLTSKMNESNLTRYPYILGDIRVSPTHLQYLRLDMEDPELATAFTYRNEYRYDHKGRGATLHNPIEPETAYHEYDGANDYYTFFKGNLTFSGTGHSPITSLDEYKMFINTILKASKGSNHAPTVEILGLNDGQDIANTLKTLNFRVKASDYEDIKLKGEIYIDKNGDGTYSQTEKVITYEGDGALDSDIEKAVSVTKDVPDSVTRFGIKVIATDPLGAQGSCEIRLNNKSTPTLTLTNNAGKYLVGDKANVELKVHADATTLSTEYKNLKLNTSMSTVKLSDISANGWTVNGTGSYTKVLNNVKFTPQPDKIDQTGSLDFTCSVEGITAFNANVAYLDSIGASKTVDGNFSIDVRTGIVKVEVKDYFGQAVKNHTVTLRGYKDSGFNTSNGYTKTALTNNTGVAEFDKVPTGYYKAEMQIPDGDDVVNSTMNLLSSLTGSTLSQKLDGELNYDNPIGLITMPKIYKKPKIIISYPSTVGLWKKIVPTAVTVDPVAYATGTITWSIVSGGDKATIDPSTGEVTGKKIGKVKVKATSSENDLNNNPIEGVSGEIEVTATNTDIH